MACNTLKRLALPVSLASNPVFHIPRICINIEAMSIWRQKRRQAMQSEKPGRALDIDAALSHVDGDSQLLRELAEMFLEDYPRLIEDARDSILQSDHSRLERIAHTLKGRLAFFGIARLRDRISELESMGREHDMTHAGRSLAEIEIEMNLVLSEFEALIREQI
jgi:HPt (histidine-containing phosphotransfer) domain-containing protein